jgi:hypothetical protein
MSGPVLRMAAEVGGVLGITDRAASSGTLASARMNGMTLEAACDLPSMGVR